MSDPDTDDHKMPIKTEIKQIISIDFGSFGSTAAFCLPHNPTSYVVLSKWSGMDNCENSMKKKTLTALLLDKTDESVFKFGFDAMQSYTEWKGTKQDIKRLLVKKAAQQAELLAADNDKQRKKFNKRLKRIEKDITKKNNILKNKFLNKDLVYFEHFKPHLMGKDRLMKDKLIKSVDGSCKISILRLIELSLIEIKKQALIEANIVRKDAKIDLDDADLKDDEVMWSVSTPCVWDETSRGAFDECVIRAGMKKHVIGLEPEFALFCMQKNDNSDFIEIGNQYMILDCGGGTVDATCIEVNSSTELAEIATRDGREIGSLMIDNEYYKMLDEIFGKDFMKSFKQKFPHKWNRCKSHFWSAKHMVANDSTSINVDFPQSFWKTFEEQFKLDDDIKEDDFEEYVIRLCEEFGTKYGNKEFVTFDDSSLQLSINIVIWKHFHQKVLDTICEFVKQLLDQDDMYDCNDIILVGGLSQSSILKQRLIDEFKDYDDRKIVYHSAIDASWSVVIGGLFWAFNKSNYTRRMWTTYGFDVDAPWDPSNDDEKNKHRNVNSSTGYIKKNVFDPIIFKNDEYEEHQEFHREYTIPAGVGKLELTLYAVDNEQGADFTTDKDADGNAICKEAAVYILKLKEKGWIKSTQQKLPVTIECEETMIRMRVTLPNGTQEEMKIANPKLKD